MLPNCATLGTPNFEGGEPEAAGDRRAGQHAAYGPQLEHMVHRNTNVARSLRGPTGHNHGSCLLREHASILHPEVPGSSSAATGRESSPPTARLRSLQCGTSRQRPALCCARLTADRATLLIDGCRPETQAGQPGGQTTNSSIAVAVPPDAQLAKVAEGLLLIRQAPGSSSIALRAGGIARKVEWQTRPRGWRPLDAETSSRHDLFGLPSGRTSPGCVVPALAVPRQLPR